MKATTARAPQPAATIRQTLDNYQRPVMAKSLWQLVNTVIPYGILGYLAFRALAHSFWLALPVLILMSGFLVRIFIIFHDCGHGSFFRSKKLNNLLGRITGLLTFTPYHYWRSSHARHHATSGNLDKRGQGDVWMMTRQEYLDASRMDRLKYRLYRNPFIMFVLGPLAVILINNRLPTKGINRSERNSILLTNLAVALYSLGMIWLMGLQAFLLMQLTVLFFAHVAGVWLFYVQHQFEGVYWKRGKEWDFLSAALEGGSFYRLPAIIRWFTGSIGYHHLHHLNSRIPNYHLVPCQKQVPQLQRVRTIGLRASLKSLNYRLWDEDSGRLIGFGELRRNRGLAPG